MGVLGAAALGGKLAGYMRSFAGPVPAATAALARAHIPGFNDVAATRETEYQLNRMSVDSPRGSFNYSSLIPEPGELIRLLHQSETSNRADGGGVTQANMQWLTGMLRNHGIDMGGQSGAWKSIVEMAATAAPISEYVVNLWRTADAAGGLDNAAAEGLTLAFQRGGFSNQVDRDILVAPWFRWSAQDAARAKWLGLLGDGEYGSILAGSGHPRTRDAELAIGLSRVLPGPHELLSWGSRGLYDGGLAGRYGLNAQSEIAEFWARAQGWDQPAVDPPGQPAATPDWRMIATRASKVLPGLGECLEMQRRFRSLPANPAVAMDGRSPVWTEENTRDMLRLHGFPAPIIDNLAALVTEPLNIRIVNEVLLEALKHPPVAALAAAATPPGVDWVAEAYLSHGVSQEWAATAAAAIRAKADDAYNEERIANKRKLREEKRRVWLERYKLGNASPGDAAAGVQDEFFDADMASTALFVVDSEVGMGLIKSQLDALKKMYLAGGIAGPQLDNQIQSLGVDSFRSAWYVQEWTWERLEGTRFASTGDILAAFKRGLLTEAGALARLQNLGWSNADALLQVAVVEHDTAVQHTAELARMAAKAAEDTQKQLRERAKAIADKQKAAIEVAKVKGKLSLEQALAAHELLAARDKYYRAVHLQNDAYAAAEKKDDKEKMAAILTAELQEYQDYLIEQTKIFHSLTGGVPSGNQIDTQEASGPDKSAVGPTGPAQPGGAAGGDTGGTATGSPTAGP